MLVKVGYILTDFGAEAEISQKVSISALHVSPSYINFFIFQLCRFFKPTSMLGVTSLFQQREGVVPGVP